MGYHPQRGLCSFVGFTEIQTLDFGKPVVVFSDHNPLTFLTETAPKSAKLMRWALALQEFDVTFHYRKGSLNVVADCLSRYVDAEGGSTSVTAGTLTCCKTD